MVNTDLDTIELNLLFNLSSDLIFQLSLDGRILSANPQFLETLKYKEKEILGTSFYDLLSKGLNGMAIAERTVNLFLVFIENGHESCQCSVALARRASETSMPLSH